MRVDTAVASSEDPEAPVGTVEIALDLVCTVKQDTRGRWVTGCLALDLFSQGRTEEEAKRCLKEAIGIWVEDCLERGTLDQALREVGFQRAHPETLHPGDEHVMVSPRQEIEPAAGTFPIHLSIPAYQAAALLERRTDA